MDAKQKISDDELLLRSYLNQENRPVSFKGNPYRKDKTFTEFPIDRDTLYRYAVLQRLLRYSMSGLPRQERKSRTGVKIPAEVEQMKQALEAGKIMKLGDESCITCKEDFNEVSTYYQEFRNYMYHDAQEILASWTSKKRKQMVDLAAREGHAAFQYSFLQEKIRGVEQKFPESRKVKLLHWWISNCYNSTLQENKESVEAGKSVGRIHFSELETKAYQHLRQRENRLLWMDIHAALEIAGRILREDLINVDQLLSLHEKHRFNEKLDWNGYTFPIQAGPFMEKPICWTNTYNFTAAVFPPQEFQPFFSAISIPYFEHIPGAIAAVRFKINQTPKSNNLICNNLIWEEMQSDIAFLIREKGVSLSSEIQAIVDAWPELAYQTARLVQQKLEFSRMYAALPWRIIENYGARIHAKKVQLYEDLTQHSATLVIDEDCALDPQPQHYRLFT